MEHLISKSSSGYGSSDQEKFFMSSHGPLPPPGSGSSGSAQSSSGLRPHSGGLLAPISIPGQSHQPGIAIQQSSHGKSGSITSGLPLRPPPTTASYHTTASGSHVSHFFLLVIMNHYSYHFRSNSFKLQICKILMAYNE